jgi:hypothetical protein
MSYWPELLIETYHLMLEQAAELRSNVGDADEYTTMNMKIVADKLIAQAEKIKKRMKSLGYYDCWEKEDELEVVVP